MTSDHFEEHSYSQQKTLANLKPFVFIFSGNECPENYQLTQHYRDGRTCVGFSSRSAFIKDVINYSGFLTHPLFVIKCLFFKDVYFRDTLPPPVKIIFMAHFSPFINAKFFPSTKVFYRNLNFSAKIYNVKSGIESRLE